MSTKVNETMQLVKTCQRAQQHGLSLLQCGVDVGPQWGPED
ncbi:hypothetical protein EYF80_052980 [Liparis tanakae]|uniref:Uncharacterized protein n=1 Tax=Liparis tanakae TaxID=230148 RepID=A0A4Z2F6G8_9TELE|nr:hypothetical protein EYF80_052980 [Liparis tanakae]